MEDTEIKKVVDWKDFRKHAHELVDYMADYFESMESRTVQHTVKPGYLREVLPDHAPENPETFHDIMKDFNDHILPGVTNWQHPNFFAFFPSNSSPPALFAEMLNKMLSSISFNWGTSPASTELEQIVMDWYCKVLNLPEFYLSNHDGGGVIHGNASETTLVSILAARDKAIAENKCDINKLTFYCSEQSHSSIIKGLMIGGIKKENTRIINTNNNDFKININDLLLQIEKDIKDGYIPCYCTLNIGSTAAGAVDDLTEAGKITQKYNIWLHVDGAYAGSAMVCPEYQYLGKGLEYSDSFVTNPHKWLLTTFECTAGWFRHRKYILNALSITPEYLRTKEFDQGVVTDYRNWQISLGRSFRSLKLWWVLRYYGVNGLRQHIRSHIQMANIFADNIKKNENKFEFLCPPFLSLVCFRLKGNDTINESFFNELSENKDIQLTHCQLDGKYSIRFCVGCPQTEVKHVENAWKIINDLSDKYIGQSK